MVSLNNREENAPTSISCQQLKPPVPGMGYNLLSLWPKGPSYTTS